MPERLKTTYLGLPLSSPIVASSGPLSTSLDNLKTMEDAGVAAVVLHSLFEEQISCEANYLDRYLDMGAESFPEATNYFPDLDSFQLGPDRYLDHIAAARESLSIPVIASLNGGTPGGWTKYAKLMEEAGASALEINAYYLPTDIWQTGEEVEKLYLDVLESVCSEVSIPIAMKLPSFFSSIPNMAARLDKAGASGLVLFNRFYQPDMDIENLEVVPNLKLSNPNELRLRLRWVAILYGQIKADLAITGGVDSAEGVLKSMMSGARVAMMTSALLRHGIGHVRTILDDLILWLDEHDYTDIKQMQGSMSQKNVANSEAFARANYLHVLSSYQV